MSSRPRGAHPDPEVHRITSAPESLEADLARRRRRYLWQMGVRLVCFVAAGLLWSHTPLWVPLALLVAAAVIPYVAVLLANAGRERQEEGEVFYEARQIGPGGRPGELGGQDR